MSEGKEIPTTSSELPDRGTECANLEPRHGGFTRFEIELEVDSVFDMLLNFI